MRNAPPSCACLDLVVRLPLATPGASTRLSPRSYGYQAIKPSARAHPHELLMADDFRRRTTHLKQLRLTTRPGTSCARSLHEGSAVCLFRGVLVVCAAEQPDPVYLMHARPGESVEVIEFH